ncbi:cysteine--tRNA ligase [Spongiibacter sp. KMU-166]|uniref:Cysteine--tRNA ligase n=1 Tax=Spongiibacter thalassae TaxID=2721624 RepID=A0ABX1GK83_9GAMM|nr:cysteine--tRNA ligase [Spongiibacter thalassae]NKI19615.1 cysteine--tRNA ligase [Spongiibacter thalassae]
MKIYNTISRSIETFVPLKKNKIGIYCCGPTVYNFAHIGNMRTYVFEDVLRRTFEGLGYDVKHVMNITDVGHLQSDEDSGDDKMSLAAKREKKSPWDIAKVYESHFFRHCEMLGIRRPHIVCRATEHIPDIISMVQSLCDKGYAYESSGNIYFDVSKFAEYAAFAKLQMGSQRATERVTIDTNKRNQADFCLWFSNSKFPNQIMKWNSPWGKGFPGWHIECSAMSAKYLGKEFDIHCGGVDHIPVHHTNEIAQSNCCHDNSSVRYWMHGEFLTVASDNASARTAEDGAHNKMSKSAGNFLTVDTLVDNGFSPLVYRYFLLCCHYRSELTFSFHALKKAEKAYLGLVDKIQEWQRELEGNEYLTTDDSAQPYLDEFWEAMSNDLKTPDALQVLWKVTRSNSLKTEQKLNLLLAFDMILGLGFDEVGRGQLTVEEMGLITERNTARANGDWVESDRIRDQLLEQGIHLKDAKTGTTWSRTKPKQKANSA